MAYDNTKATAAPRLETPPPLVFIEKLFQNFSFETVPLDFREKADFRPLFPRGSSKLTEF
jgi:hypothetical protein